MRLLVACTECERQYDASGRQDGSRFRCHCGEVVTVTTPAGHDARVVRCSGCGAPREEGSPRCEFCRADFTLRERDLHTVCPSCMTRVSDRAKFCHSCGDELGVEMTVDEITEMPCPVCGEEAKLVSRKLGANRSVVMECQRCAGMWLSKATFTRITNEAAKRSAVSPFETVAQRAKAPTKNQSGSDISRWAYRSCVVCDALMHRTQYSRGSGVIIDTCRHHGTWLDAQELPQILAWIRGGGPLRSQDEARSNLQIAEQERQAAARKGRRASETPLNKSGSWNTWGDPTFDILRDLFGL